MRTLSMAAAAALALVALSGCLRDSDNVPPTVEEIARDDYARIAGDANVILFGDAVGYRAGATTAERVPTVCRDASCSLGFRRAFSADSFSAEDVELEVLTGRNGVRLVVERSSSDETDVTVFGGWMEHSFFASQANLFTDETNLNHGATVFYSYVLGHSTGESPAVTDGGAHWRGFVVGRDSGTAASLEAVVQGDAEISVEMRQSGLLADVMFTDLTNAHTGAAYDDMVVDRHGGCGRGLCPGRRGQRHDRGPLLRAWPGGGRRHIRARRHCRCLRRTPAAVKPRQDRRGQR